MGSASHRRAGGVGPRDGGRQRGLGRAVSASRARVSVREDESSGGGGGDGRTTMRTCLLPWTGHLDTAKMVNSMLCIFYYDYKRS